MSFWEAHEHLHRGVMYIPDLVCWSHCHRALVLALLCVDQIASPRIWAHCVNPSLIVCGYNCTIAMNFTAFTLCVDQIAMNFTVFTLCGDQIAMVCFPGIVQPVLGSVFLRDTSPKNARPKASGIAGSYRYRLWATTRVHYRSTCDTSVALIQFVVEGGMSYQRCAIQSLIV